MADTITVEILFEGGAKQELTMERRFSTRILTEIEQYVTNGKAKLCHFRISDKKPTPDTVILNVRKVISARVV